MNNNERIRYPGYDDSIFGLEGVERYKRLKEIEGDNIKFRIEMLSKCQKNDSYKELVWLMCRDDIIMWFNCFCFTYDPRISPSNIPFITYPFQNRFIMKLVDCIERDKDIIIEKSRDMGATWMILGVIYWGFLFKGWTSLLGSYKEDYVDRKGNMDSHFERIRYINDNLPIWMRPSDLQSYFQTIHSKICGSEIAGDAGENFGTGGRRKLIFMDEFALWNNAETAYRKTRDISRCRIINGCITKDSLIIGKQGIEYIGECKDGYNIENKEIYGNNGFHTAIQRYGNGYSKTIKIITNFGYEIEGTYNHKILGPNGWCELQNLVIGDNVFIQQGQNIFGDIDENKDFCYLLGLYLSQGTIEKTIKNNKYGNYIDYCSITISDGNKETIGWLIEKYGFHNYDGMHSRKGNKNLIKKIIEYITPNIAKHKTLGNKIFKLNKESMIMFLRGYFDGDGCCYGNRDKGGCKQVVSCSSASKELIKQIQIILLNFGIISKRKYRLVKPTNKIKVYSNSYQLYIEGYGAYKYIKEIGFNKKYKIDKGKYFIEGNGYYYYYNKNDFKHINKVNSSLYSNKKKLVSKNILLKILPYCINNKQNYKLDLVNDYIKSIEYGENYCYDFVIPETKQYFANGFIVHNTPNGKFNIYGKIMTNHPDYKELIIEKYRLHWSEHPLKDKEWYENEKRVRTKYDMATEIDISYDDSVAGAVYSDFAEMCHFGKYEYDGNMNTYTGWDFGLDGMALVVMQKDMRLNVCYIVNAIKRTGWGIKKFMAFVLGRPSVGYTYSEKDMEEIRKMSKWRYNGHYGDPYNGKSNNAISESSFYSELAKEGVYLQFKRDTTVEERIKKVILSYDRIYINEDLVEFIEDIRQSHYPKIKEGSDLTKERSLPVHDSTSHFRTAFEYVIDNEVMTVFGSKKKKVSRMNLLTGKIE